MKPLRDYQNRRVKRVRSVRVTNEEWFTVKVAARKLGVTTSAFVRTAILYYLDKNAELVENATSPFSSNTPRDPFI